MSFKKDIPIILTIICISLFGIFYFFVNTNNEATEYSNIDIKTNNFDEQTVESSTTIDIQKIIAYISGEVKAPGVYEFTKDKRVNDLVAEAGGFTEDAYTENINLAEKLVDEAHIHVYNKEEIKKVENQTINLVENQNNLININTSNKEELIKLPGIGETIANSIIEYREQNGDFGSIEEIKNVNRIGDKTFDKLKDLITIK